MPDPNPCELDLVLTPGGVAVYKRYDCRRYGSCLTIAADAGWQQFHCNNCMAYVPIPKDDTTNDLFDRAGRHLVKNGKNR